MHEHDKWLQFAYDDLRTAKKLSEGDDAIVSTGMFHAQQCAEKSLKAYLVYQEEPLRRIHDLLTLVELCQRFDKDFKLIEDEAADLNPYLCQTRYPDDCPIMPDLTVLQISVKQAQKIYDLVISKIR